MAWRFLFLPIAPLYRGAVAARETAYRRGWLERARLDIPVISVGNLTFGGTGKTPTVIALVRDLVRMGRRPAVLTRGYKRRDGAQVVVVGPEPRQTVREVGDEPLEMARRLPGVPVVVDADRERGGREAYRLGADVVVLDDGFQHLKLERDLDLVLLDAGDPWGGGRLPPLGRLREPVSALGRAGAVLITKVPADWRPVVEEIEGVIDRIAPHLQVFVARMRPTRVRVPSEGWKGAEILAGKRIYAFAGLGRPQGFAETLESAGAEIVGHRWFPDHHDYSGRDLAEVSAAADEAGAIAVTTAKDGVKLADERSGVGGRGRDATGRGELAGALAPARGVGIVSKNRSALRNSVEFAAYRFARGLTAVLPPAGLASVGDVLGSLYSMIGGRRRRIIDFNLELAYPEKSRSDRRRLARSVARHFGRSALDAIRVQGLRPEELTAAVEISGWENVENAAALGRGVFFLTAHIGSWEVAALIVGLRLEGGLSVVNRPLDNPLLERELDRLRKLYGNHVFGKRNIVREMLTQLRRGAGVGILIDQRVREDQGVEVPFFGHPAWTHPILARMARKTGAPVVPLFAFLEAPGSYTLRFDPAIVVDELAEADRDDEALTARYIAVLESAIRERPEQWLWYHDRWKQFRLARITT